MQGEEEIMKNKSQKEKVKEILILKGYIDNVYDCVQTALTLRLSNKIRELTGEGWVFDQEKSGYFPVGSKNWRYYLAKDVRQPFQPKYKYVPTQNGMREISISYEK